MPTKATANERPNIFDFDSLSNTSIVSISPIACSPNPVSPALSHVLTPPSRESSSSSSSSVTGYLSSASYSRNTSSARIFSPIAQNNISPTLYSVSGDEMSSDGIEFNISSRKCDSSSAGPVRRTDIINQLISPAKTKALLKRPIMVDEGDDDNDDAYFQHVRDTSRRQFIELQERRRGKSSTRSGEANKERRFKEYAVNTPSFVSMPHHPATLQRLPGGSDINSTMSRSQFLPKPLRKHRPMYTTFSVASTSQNPYPHPDAHPNVLSLPTPYSSDHNSSGMDVLQKKTNMFVCPLVSCCRSFVTDQHLKRHLRTHNSARPYQCKRCNKRFFRSRNLERHIRAHTGTDSQGSDTSGYDNEQADVESDGMDELDGDGDAYNTSVYLDSVRNLQTSKINMGEMEIYMNVQKIYGDEGGLEAAGGAADRNDAQYVYHASQLGSRGNSQLPSVAYTAISVPSSHIQIAKSQRLDPLGSSSTGDTRQSLAVYSSHPEYATSVSAPSHNHHSSLYPAHLGMIVPPTSSPGPIRRHRGITPRPEVRVQRPMTASTDLGSPSRGYHPYAVPMSGYTSQSSNSTQSSPASSHAQFRPNSTGRGSQDRVHQVLDPEFEVAGDSLFVNNATSSGQHAYGIYRTESPTPSRAPL